MVVDECAQATEPEVVLSVMRAPVAMAPQILPRLFVNQGAEDRAILVGDHKQLGPVVTEHSLCKAFLVMLERHAAGIQTPVPFVKLFFHAKKSASPVYCWDVQCRLASVFA